MSIVVNSVGYVHPDGETLFENISFTLQRGEKASLIGNNGAGKSTLLRIISGRQAATRGEIALAGEAYYIPQHGGQYDSPSVLEALQAKDKVDALYAILAGEVSEENLYKLNDDWEIEERIRAALDYWDMHHIDASTEMNRLSGGEKTRVLLAGLFLHSPDIILLDEPTNHLDFESREALYAFVNESDSALLIVSHDRKLLNLMDKTIELNPNGTETYGGPYDFYRSQKEAKTQALQAQLDDKERSLKQAKLKAREIDRQRQKQETRGNKQKQKAGTPRIVMGGLKNQAERSSACINHLQADKIAALCEDRQQLKRQIEARQTMKFDIKASDLHKGKTLIRAEGINIRYSEKDLWKEAVSFQVNSGDRLHIRGKNGSGKTSLVKLIAQNAPPSEGKLFVASFRSLYVDQEYSIIDSRLTVFEQAAAFNDRLLPEHELKMLLHYHRFPAVYWDRPCALLSGGEKMKLLLCCLVVSNNVPDLLILDEPTNNLDIHSQEVLTETIRDFDGALLLISHDQTLIDSLKLNKSIELTPASATKKE